MTKRHQMRYKSIHRARCVAFTVGEFKREKYYASFHSFLTGNLQNMSKLFPNSNVLTVVSVRFGSLEMSKKVTYRFQEGSAASIWECEEVSGRVRGVGSRGQLI